MPSGGGPVGSVAEMKREMRQYHIKRIEVISLETAETRAPGSTIFTRAYSKEVWGFKGFRRGKDLALA